MLFGPAASQFAWLTVNTEARMDHSSIGRLPTNMAGICSWPWKREVARYSRNRAKKCGVPFFSPISSISLYPTAGLTAQWNVSAWKSKKIILAMTIWSHVAAWQMSLRLVFWLERDYQGLTPLYFLQPSQENWPSHTSEMQRKRSGTLESNQVKHRLSFPDTAVHVSKFGWTVRNQGCCTMWKVEFSYSGSKVAWWSFQSGEARNTIKVRQQICSVCGHKREICLNPRRVLALFNL